MKQEVKLLHLGLASQQFADVIGISEAQLPLVTNTSAGMGLIKCGNVVIPFDNTINKGSDLYNLYNTNIQDCRGEEKEGVGGC